MAATIIPEGGLALPPPPAHTQGHEEITLPQIIQLNLENGMLYDMMKATRHGARNPLLTCGKSLSLQYGNKKRLLSSKPSRFPLFLYDCPTEGTPQIHFTGRFTHEIEVQQAEEDRSGEDEALAQLQNSLASHKEVKQSHQIVYLPDSSSLPPAKKQTVASLKHRQAKNSSLAQLKRDKKFSHTKDSITRSLPSSPAMAPSRPPVYTSRVENENRLHKAKINRCEALRTPLIHLLAHSQLSFEIIARRLKCRKDDLKEVLPKVGKPWKDDNEKWDLKEQAFKELNVWSFRYKDGDRETAIQRAIAAFDRMRLSPSDDNFQRLLPQGERNKGKILSKLNHLGRGPIKPNGTPRIHVQQPDDVSKGSEQDRSRRADVDDDERKRTVRSKSHESPKKIKPSEKDVKSKRLLSKGTRNNEQQQQNQLASRHVAKKINAPLSSEYVNDSDEEDKLEASTVDQAHSPLADVKGNFKDHKAEYNETKNVKQPTHEIAIASASSAASNSASKPKQRSALPKKVNQGQGIANKRDPQRAQKAPAKKPDGSVTGKKRKEPESGPADPSTAKRPRNISSPNKPSPLGSSPPANASDIEDKNLSSASSTPFLSVTAKDLAPSNHTKGPTRNTCERSLKRKANNADDHVRDHHDDRPNGLGTSHGRATKHPRTNIYTPPASDSPSPPSATAKKRAIDNAKNFKIYYPTYEKLYKAVKAMDRPPQERIEELEKMHKRLEELKQEIREDYEKVEDWR